MDGNIVLNIKLLSNLILILFISFRINFLITYDLKSNFIGIQIMISLI